MIIAYFYLVICFHNSSCVVIPEKMTQATCYREAEKQKRMITSTFCVNTQTERDREGKIVK